MKPLIPLSQVWGDENYVTISSPLMDGILSGDFSAELMPRDQGWVGHEEEEFISTFSTRH
jgi:hypothetical protein